MVANLYPKANSLSSIPLLSFEACSCSCLTLSNLRTYLNRRWGSSCKPSPENSANSFDLTLREGSLPVLSSPVLSRGQLNHKRSHNTISLKNLLTYLLTSKQGCKPLWLGKNFWQDSMTVLYQLFHKWACALEKMNCGGIIVAMTTSTCFIVLYNVGGWRLS